MLKSVTVIFVLNLILAGGRAYSQEIDHSAGLSAAVAPPDVRAATRAPGGDVLEVPPQDCRDAAILLASVAREFREAELSASDQPNADDYYTTGLRDISHARCAEGIKWLRAADKALQTDSMSPGF
jgi:hypothetical protein